MKKIILALALLATTGAITESQAQIRVNINIGTQPLWGPTGYDYAQYYYMPEVGVYYDVTNRVYYYPSGRRWVSTAVLPARFGRVNLFSTYKVVLNENRPWLRDGAIRAQYAGYRDRHDQGVIRDSRESRYWENANHPHHNDWVREHRNDRRDNGIDREADRSDRRGGRGRR